MLNHIVSVQCQRCMAGIPGNLLKVFFVLTLMVQLYACSGGSDSSGGNAKPLDLGHEPLVQQKFTYYEHVKPIIDEHCVNCHREGNIAPFPLTSYDEVSDFKAAIDHVVKNRTMPPWLPSPGYVEYNFDRSLTREERYTLIKWIRDGAPRGTEDPASPSSANIDHDNFLPTESDGDVVLTLPQPYTPRPVDVYNGADDLRCFIVEWPLDETAYITAAGLIPDVTEQTHHAVMNVIDPEVVDVYAGFERDKEEGDTQIGYSCFTEQAIDFDYTTMDPEQLLLAQKHPPRLILGWAPGTPLVHYPQDSGLRVEPGSLIMIQMHYNNIATGPVPDQPKMIFKVTDSVKREGSYGLITDSDWVAVPDIPPIPFLLPEGISASPGNMLIPAGEPEVTHWAELGRTTTAIPELDFKNITLYTTRLAIGLSEDEGYAIHSIGTHMHYLGSASQISVRREDGSEYMLQDIPDWDFEWQQPWWLKEEVIVGPNDKLYLSCSWDNSAENQQVVNGEQLTPRDITWGDGSTTEMCLTQLFITKIAEPESQPVAPTVYIDGPDYGKQVRAGDTIEVRLNINNFILQEPGDSPQARAGYYRIALDDGLASTKGTAETLSLQLPEDLASGPHLLNVSLYDTSDKNLGIYDVIEIEIVSD